MSSRWLPPELPHLARLLDPVTVGELVNTRPLPAQDLVECRLTHIRYRPHQNCTLTWEGRTAAGIVRWFSILACRDGQSRQEYLTATTTSPFVASVGHDAFHLPGFDAVLRMFPSERRLDSLHWLARPARLIEELAVLMPGKCDDVRLTIVQYVAERGCTVRLTNSAGAAVAYGKFQRPGESARTWRMINNLWSVRPHPSGLIIPEPLAWHAGSESFWLGELAGQTLDGNLTNHHFPEVGRALASLHRVRLESSPPDIPDIASQLPVKIAFLTAIRPDLEGRLKGLAQQLAAIEPQMEGEPATLHGDLHLKNLIALPDGRIGLIDLDNLGYGDPLIDLGGFAASLYYRGLAPGHSPELTAHQVELLCQGYQRATGAIINCARLRALTAAALINERAWRTVTRLRDDCLVMIERLLAVAERMVTP